jgi:hypothetical protein
MTGSAEVGYQLGSHDAELERLNLQGRLLAPATRTIFEMAGIESGMKVLDLGSGAGDVSFLHGPALRRRLFEDLGVDRVLLHDPGVELRGVAEPVLFISTLGVKTLRPTARVSSWARRVTKSIL